MLCDAFKPKVDALSLAGMLDPLALKQMLQAFVNADWGTTEKFALASKARDLDQMMESLSQMTPSERDSMLEDEKLDHNSILDLVRQLWTAAKRGGTYPPALNAPDRRAVPSQFNQANTLTQVTPRDRNIAPQQGATRDRGRNGGGPGRGRGYGRGAHGQHQRQGQRNGGSAGNSTGTQKPNRIPPAAGAPLSKEVNGKKYHWCSRCHSSAVSH